MTQGLFVGIARTISPDFKISVKVPEIITHDKRLEINKDVMTVL